MGKLLELLTKQKSQGATTPILPLRLRDALQRTTPVSQLPMTLKEPKQIEPSIKENLKSLVGLGKKVISPVVGFVKGQREQSMQGLAAIEKKLKGQELTPEEAKLAQEYIGMSALGMFSSLERIGGKAVSKVISKIPKAPQPLAQEARKAEELLKEGVFSKNLLEDVKQVNPSNDWVKVSFNPKQVKYGGNLSEMNIRHMDKAFQEFKAGDKLMNPAFERIQKQGTEKIPIVIEKITKDGEISILDGSHRLAFARAKNTPIEAYIPKSQLTDFYNQAVRGVKEVVEEVAPKAKPFDFEAQTLKEQERKFIGSIYNSPELNPELGKRLREMPEAYYGIRHNPAAVEKAQKLIFDNITLAEKMATTEVTDDAIFTAAELVKQATYAADRAKLAGDMPAFEAAMEKALKSAQNLTEAGRTVQAASTISRLSPDGIIKFINKIYRKVGAKEIELSNELYYKIVKQAEDITNTFDPKERALKSFQLLDDIYSHAPSSVRNKVYEVLNIPRAIMATADVSAGFRQGIFYAPRHPIKFAKAFGQQFKYFFSDKAYQNFKADIVTSPNYDLYLKYKLPLADIQKGLSSREERFMSTWAEKIPFVGRVVSASNRAYTGLLNRLRLNIFDDFIEKGKILKITDEKFFNDAAEFAGSATGRGGLGSLENAAVALNSTFFSPRLMASRLRLLNPVYYAKLHPVVRKEALKSLFAFAGTITGVLALAKMGGADVGVNPNSADFGKIKIGKTRIDIMGGFQQYIRMASQIITGKYVSSTTGKEMTLGEGYKAMTRWDILLRQLQSKESPVASFITALMQGQDYAGKPLKISKEIVNRFTPMVIQDIIDLAKEDPKLIPLGALGMVGMGLQTYRLPEWSEATSFEKYMKMKEMPAEERDKLMAEIQAGDKQTYNAITKYAKWDELKLTPQEKGFSTLGVEDGTRTKAILEYMKGQKNRQETYKRLEEAKIITEEIDRQIRELLAK